MFICTHSCIHCPENARECQNELIIIMIMLSKREMKNVIEKEKWQQSAKYLNLLKDDDRKNMSSKKEKVLAAVCIERKLFFPH